MDDLKAHFRTGYAPNNCVMVVVGDVTDGQIIELAKKYIEPIPTQPLPPAVRTKEPEQLGERRVTLRKPAQLPIQMVAYHVPESKNPDTPGLEVLEALLSPARVAAFTSAWWIRINWPPCNAASSRSRSIPACLSSPCSRAAA